MPGWFAPTLVYVVAIGGLGVTTKLALEHLSWQTLIVWTMAAYVVVGLALLATGSASLGLGAGTPMALLSAVLAVGGLMALYVALGRGDAGAVVPVSSVYPVVTLLLGALVLAERLTPQRVAGVLLVIAGLVLVTRA